MPGDTARIRFITRDVRLLFAARVARLFAYGLVSVILVLYLAEIGLSESRIGLLLSATLLGDTAISLWMTTRADRLGRRRMLVFGAALVLAGGVVFAATDAFAVLLVAAIIGVISPSGNEVGPFLALEQAALSQSVEPSRRTATFAWYSLAASFATAVGSLAGGAAAELLQRGGADAQESYRVLLFAYAGAGLLLMALFWRLSPAVEATSAPAAAPLEGLRARWGLHRSRGVVLRLSSLFAVDAFAGGFVVQSFVAYWFHRRFGADPALLGTIFFGANALAGVSALTAAWVAKRIGLVNAMVFTHLPSNVLLFLVPLMPTLEWAVAVLFLRFSISQMDVPTRQSYTMAVVAPDERSAAAGITGIARTVGAALSPVVAGPLYAHPALAGVPFFIAGGIKALYDLVLWRSFRLLRPPEENARDAERA
ncbi:MAG TPA: MFS transporter, partial [Myxococcaceae bacterium]|nr:MFS transporter [Myxococcaceae bacterium]